MINISTEHEILTEIFDFKHIKELNGCERIYFDTLHELKNEEAIYYANCVFVVKNIEKTLVGERVIYSVEALEKFYCDMIDLFEYSETTATLNLSKACDIIFSGTGWTYTLESNLTSVAFENFGNDSKSALFQTVLKRYKREFEVDYRNKNIYIAREIGKDESVVFRYKKNIVAISETVDTKELTTYIEAEGKDGLYVKYTSVNAEKFGVRHAKKIKDERYVNIEELTEYARQSIQDVPLVAFEIDALVIDEDLSLGDKVFVIHEKLGIDIHARVLAIEEMPLDRQKRKTIKLGNFVEVGFSDRVISKVEDYFDATSQADKELQAKIDAANAAIDKEYNDRVQAVTDAIAKAEADAEVMKEELQTEISQAVTDWNTEFEEAKTNIDNSIGNVSKELGEYIESTDEIIERVDSELSELFDGLEANSGAITTITTEQGILSAKVGEVVVTADSALSKATEAQITADGFSTRVGSLETSDSTQNSKLTKLEQTADGLTSTVSEHTSDINGLNSTVSTHTSEIKQTSDKISMVVSNGSTASAVQLTPNALTAIAKDINLKGNVQFDSLVEGDGTNTQILGGKIKTNSISANKLIVGNSQSLVRLTKGEGNPNTDIVAYHPYWGLTFKDEGLPVCSLTPHFKTGEAISTEQLGWANKEIKLRITHNIFYGPYVPFYFEVYCFDDNGAVTISAQTEQINPSHNVNSIQNHVIDLGVIDQNKHRYVYVRLLRPTTESFGEYGVNTLTITEMNAGELIVDGAIKANHIVSGSAELGAVTSKVLSTEALNAAWANIGNAFINKLTSDDALFQRLTAKSAWITSANIVSLEASRIKGGTLQSTNGAFNQNLDTGVTTYTASGANSQINMGTYYGATGLHLISGVANSGALMFLATNGLGYFNTDTASFGRSGQHSGFKVVTNAYDKSDIATTNPAACRIIPWTAGTGSVGQGDYPIFEVRAKTITDVLSTFNLPTTFSSNQSFSNSSALEVVVNCPVRDFFFGDTVTNTFNFEDDVPKNTFVGIDFTPLRTTLSEDGTTLFTAQNEMTLNTEIAILWKAVQELSMQINEMKGA